jgi:hypothetical protein
MPPDPVTPPEHHVLPGELADIHVDHALPAGHTELPVQRQADFWNHTGRDATAHLLHK